MTRRRFLESCAAGALAAGIAGCGRNGGLPNIVLVMADDLGYGDLGCYGAMQIPTPNIDRLARQGIRFTDAHSAAALCTPSRYSVLTGRYCWRSRLKKGVLNGYDPLLIDPGRLTLASLLRDSGYATACVGKWHLGLGDSAGTDYSAELRPGPLELGFDYFFGLPASLDMPPYCFVENHRTVGELGPEKQPYNTLQRPGTMTPGWRDEEVGPTLTSKALEFIHRTRGADPHQPFFLYLPYHAPHTPCTPPDFIRGGSTAGVRGDMVTELDWAVGRIMETLDQLGIADNTLLAVTSDNGALTTGPEAWDGEPRGNYDLEHNGHHPNGDLRGQKSDIWEGGHREPLIVRWPRRVRAGAASDRLVCLTDLLATFAGLTGRSLPDNAGEDSFSLLPALTGENAVSPERESLVHHSGSGMFSVRRGDWKLVLGLGSGGFSKPNWIEPASGAPRGRLYDLRHDPAEQHDLYAQHPQLVAELEALLLECVRLGRSTPGQAQSNEGEVEIWVQAGSSEHL